MSFEELSYADAVALGDPSQVLAIEEKVGAIDGIADFGNLRSLNVIGNSNVKDFRFLEKLPQLEKLYIADLGLSEIPAEVGKLQNLTTLFLGKNPIKDFSLVAKLPNLIDLGIEECNLKKIPDPVLAVKGLEVLGLYGNSISSLAQFKAFPHLRKLYIANNSLKKIPKELLKLKQLTHLDLIGNNWLEDCDILWEMTQLELLSMSSARGSNAVGPGLYRLTNLRELMLQIYYDESSDLLGGLEGIGELSKLEILTISGGDVKRLPESFSRLKALKELTLRDESLEDISALRDLPALEKIDLGSCNIKTIPEGFSTLTGLNELRLSHNKPLESVPGLRDLPALEKLEMYSKIPALPDTMGTLTGLKVLKLSAGKCEVDFLKDLINLEELYIADVLFEAIPETLTKLKKLTVFRYVEETDDNYLVNLPALEDLEVNQPSFKLPVLPKLRSLSVGKIKNGLDLDALASMPELRELTLDRSDGLLELPPSIAEAKGLQKITFEFLKNLRDLTMLRDLPSLREFEASYLNIGALPPSFATLKGLEHVTLNDMDNLVDISVLGELPGLRSLTMSSLDELASFPTSFEKLKHLERVKLRRMDTLKDVSVLSRLSKLQSFEAEYCKSLRRAAIAEIENAIAAGGSSDAGAELKMSYAQFMESGAYKRLNGKEDATRTYSFPLWFATPDVLRDSIEDFSWTDDVRDDEEREEAAILTDADSDVVPLAILDFGWDGCDMSDIDAYSEEIFLVDTANAKNPVLIWGHDGGPSVIHATFDDFLANLRDFQLEGDDDSDEEEEEQGNDNETYLEFVEGTSSKFWRIVVEGNEHTVTFGKIGTAGQSKTKEFADASAAQEEAEKLIKSKRKKGYVDGT